MLFKYKSKGKWTDQRDEVKKLLEGLELLPERSATWMCYGMLETMSRITSKDDVLEISVNITATRDRSKRVKPEHEIYSPRMGKLDKKKK